MAIPTTQDAESDFRLFNHVEAFVTREFAHNRRLFDTQLVDGQKSMAAKWRCPIYYEDKYKRIP